MRVILNDYIEHLGERGDTVTVKPGYARNYLIPKGLAYPDTPGNRRRFDQEQSRWEEMDLSRRGAAEKMAGELTGTELLFERRASEKDVLFGSVSVVDMARELADRGFDVDKRRIALGQPIKALGSFEVDVYIHRDVKVTLPVHVVRPGEEPQAAAEQETEAEAAAVEEAAAVGGEEPAVETEPTAEVEPAAEAEPTVEAEREDEDTVASS
jgi:large subunit ribosomal protein L9